MKKNTSESTPQFLRDTEHLGITDPRIRSVADALYLQYVHQSIMIFSQGEQGVDQLVYMQVLGAIRALEELLKHWGQADLVEKLKDLVNTEDVELLKKRTR